MNRVIDIIIPIYAGTKEILDCVDSVMRYSDGLLGKIILINDCSPYLDVQLLMNEYQSMSAQNEQLIVASNETNLGYLRTCNLAYTYTTNDVVFLNSDTIVTSGWLSKIAQCAYRDPRIGIVSPLTNSGMLCSVPVIGNDNHLPSGMTLESYAALIERSSLQKYPIVPSAFGFCMFVKRAVLESVGLFDECFGQGYYEENDFCCRARRNGWISVICDDTYIYHHGSVSFSKRKYDISKANEELIQNKFPYIIFELSKFNEAISLREIQANIFLQTRLRQKFNRTVLHILHKSPYQDSPHIRGGVEYHVFDLIDKTKSEMNVFALYPEYSEFNTSFVLRGFASGVETIFHFNISTPMIAEMQWNPEVGRMYETILAALQVSSVHIHHLIGHTWQIADCCDSMQIPYFVTLHDLNLLCPNYSFQLPDGRPCGAEQRPERCQPESCFGGTFASGSAYLRTYRAEINRRLERAKYIFSPSEYIKTTYSKWYVNLTFKNIPHWPPAYEMPDCGLALENEDSSLLRVAIIGAVTPIKGSSLLCEVLDRGIPYVRWYLFGALGDPCVLAFESDNVIIYGAYKRNEIVKLLFQNTIDVVCLLSKTNESYGYTLSEAWLAKCPVICTPSGAICERVENSGGGWVVHDADEIVSVLSALHKNRNLIKEQRNNIPDFVVEDRNTAIQQYIDFYKTSFSQPVYTPSPQANLALLNAWTRYNQYNVSTQNQPFIIQLAKLYYDDGTGYCEEHHLQALITIENNFSLEFNFLMPTVCRSIRFDIIDGFQTHVRIESATVINSDGTERILDSYVHNGKELAGLIQFETIDPNILWSMPELPIKSVRIQGTWHLVLPSPDQVISAPSITLDSKRSLINRIQCKVFLLLRRIRYKYERALLKRKSKRL